MDTISGEKSVIISINDILDELMVENKRLFNELLFANKLKTHLIKIHSKYQTMIDCEDITEWHVLTQLMNNSFNTIHDSTHEECVAIKSEDICNDNTRQSRGRPAKTKRSNCDQKAKQKVGLVVKQLKRKYVKSGKYKALPKTLDNNVLNVRQLDDLTEDNNETRNRKRKLIKSAKYREYKQWTRPSDRSKPVTITAEEVFNSLRQKYDSIEAMKDPISRQFKCPVISCTKTHHNIRGLSYHLQKRHQMVGRITSAVFAKQLYCSYTNCHFETKHTARLDKHYKEVHNSDRNYECDVCHKMFKSIGNLKNHKRDIHSDGPPIHQCTHDGCPEAFRYRHGLRMHMESIHGIARPVIECCWPGCTFSTARNDCLKMHVRRCHTNNRPYVCDWPECGKGFVTKDKLQHHMNIHGKVKPYACVWPGCSYRCSCPANIHKHMRVHRTDRL